MNEDQIRSLLEQVSTKTINVEDALGLLRGDGLDPVGNFAVIDSDREARTGFPEVIFSQGKTDEQIVEIFSRLVQKNPNVMATRLQPSVYERIRGKLPESSYDPIARILFTRKNIDQIKGAAVVTAGTGDIPVAEEAALTAEIMGIKVGRIYDVGVSGIHRLFARLPEIQKAKVVIVVAGMEGALASVVGGLVSAPVIAVPTSVGYGASFNGLAALLSMLNSCANGVSVVNIDNGYGAGCIASRFIHMSRNEK